MHDPPHTPRIRHEQCREGLCGTQNRAKICPGTHSGSPVVPKSVPGASREHLGSAPGRPWRAPGAPGGSSNYLETNSAGGWLGFFHFIRFLLILTVKTDMIVILSRPLSRSGAVLPQNARVDATFSRCIAFSQSRWPWGGPPAGSIPFDNH